MKKQILFAWLASLALMLGGCGSNDMVDGGNAGSGEAKTALDTSISTSEAGKDFNITMTVEKNIDSEYLLTLKDFELLSVGGCEIASVNVPDTIQMSGGKGSKVYLTFSGTFQNSCRPTSHKIQFLQVTSRGDRSVSETITYDSTAPAGGGGTSGGEVPAGGFFNATTPLEITQASHEYEIKVQVLENGYAVSEKEIKYRQFDSKYGTISNLSAFTNSAGGYAVFQYKSPAVLPANGTSATVTLTHDNNGTVITQDIVLQFKPVGGGGSQYSLTSPTTPVIINTDNEVKAISAVVIDQNGVGVKDVDVSITAISEAKYGAIISIVTVKTDASGRASFAYQAPGSIAAVDGESTVLKLFLKDDMSIEKNVAISFTKINQNISLPRVVVANNYREINITQNSQNIEMEIQVFEQGTNTPYTTGNVKVSLPSNVLQGVDVGSFSAYTAPVGNNGKAVFNYTGPQDLQSLIDSDEMNATFQFFHEDNPTQKEPITAVYDLQTGYVPANYLLTTSSTDGKQTMDLNTLKTFTFYLKDDQGTLVDGADISAITITSQNTLVGKLMNTSNGNEVTELVFNGANALNSKSFSVRTNTLSGLLPIKIKVDFTNASGDAASRTIIMNIVVLSGPPTAMSISYTGVEQNSTIGKYIEKFAVTVTDAYNNPVNTRPYVATGAIVEYAVDGSSSTGERSTTSPRLWHGTSDPRGTVESLGGDRAQFTTTTDIFNWADIDNDRLVVFGGGFVYEALGKWDLNSVDPQLLGLKDDYYGTTRSDLGFAIGHNNRQDLCSGDQREYVGNMKSDRYQIDENGNALIEFVYDYHLTGKDIMVWVNLTGFQADNNKTGRIGEAQKHTLRGNGLVPVPSGGYKILKGTTRHGVSFAIDHENAPEWYQNGKFGWAVKSGSSCDWSIDDSSNFYDARTCYGTAYISFTLTAAPDKDCTFAIERINTATEFTGVNSH